MQIGYTPLHCASYNGHTDVVELLIGNDAHIDVPAKVGVGAQCHNKSWVWPGDKATLYQFCAGCVTHTGGGDLFLYCSDFSMCERTQGCC